MKQEKYPVFVAVAWPYVNGNLHVGHVAGYLLPADITARFFRLMDHPVLMVSGSDCFGTPITVEADKKGITPEEVVNLYHPKNVSLFENLGLTYDLYTKTTTENHKAITQEFLLSFYKKGLLTVKSAPQYYSKSENKFLPDRYVEGKCPVCGFIEARSDQCDNCGSLLNQNLIDPVSKLDKKPVELKDTEHLYVSWDKLQPKIEKYFKKSSKGWRKWVKAETEKWLEKGLNERAVTRDLDWGVAIPKEIVDLKNSENKRIYVWFDAVIGYYSASLEWSQKTGGSWENFWKNKEAKHYYFMGKDNLIFHTIFWPGQLMTFDEKLNLPDFPAINQYLNLEGAKFSKSRGVVIDTAEFIEKYGSDALRFYLCSIMPETADSDFVWDDFFKKNNDLLVGHIGNYVHRTLSIFKDTSLTGEITHEVLEKISEALTKSIKLLKNNEFKAYLNEVEILTKYANGFFNECAPWITKKSDSKKFENDANNLVSLTYAISSLLEPITPKGAQKYREIVGIQNNEFWISENNLESHLETIVKNIKIKNPLPLFQKFEKEE